MTELFEKIVSHLNAGENVVLCSILASSGSCPRGAGAKLAVFCDGSTCGTVGGGAVELLAVRQAATLHAQKRSFCEAYTLTEDDKSGLGMICGGAVTVYFQFFSAESEADRAFVYAVRDALRENRNSWLIHLKSGDTLTGALYDEAHGLRFASLPMPLLRPYLTVRPAFRQQEPSFYIEPLVRAGRVWLFGGGHVGQALVPILEGADFRVTVYDDRPDFARREYFPDAQSVMIGSYDRIEQRVQISPEDYVVIMTPGHRADTQVLRQVLQTPACYIGCIGSKTKAEKTRQLLLEEGVTERQLSRIHCPIGLPLYGQTPAEIAVSIAAEMIRHRALRSGADRKT